MRPAATRKLIAASRGDEFPPNGTSIGDEREKEPRMMAHFIARSRTTIVLVAGAVAAWAVTVDRMRGMDAGPGTDLGGLGWYLGIWVTMTAAMMLPSAAPTARHVGRLAHRVPTLLFTGGDPGAGAGHRPPAPRGLPPPAPLPIPPPRCGCRGPPPPPPP